MGFGDNLKNALGLGSGPKGSFTSGQDLVRQQDKLSRFNINSDFGSRNFSKDSSGRSVLNIEETDFQKALRGMQENQALGLFGSKAPSADDFAQQGQDIQNALFESSMLNLRPEFENEDIRTNDFLSNRGIPLGGEAYKKALSSLRRDRGNQLNQLGLQAALAGRQEQDRLVRLGEAQRAARFAETGSVTQGIDMSLFGNVAGIDAAGIISGQEGSQNAYNLSRFQDSQARRSAAATEAFRAGGAGAAGGGGASASDINLKENIRKIGLENEFNIYEFNYIGKPGRYRGVMAQEVQETRPDAVVEKDGYLAVHYDKIGVEFKQI